MGREKEDELDGQGKEESEYAIKKT